MSAIQQLNDLFVGKELHRVYDTPRWVQKGYRDKLVSQDNVKIGRVSANDQKVHIFAQLDEYGFEDYLLSLDALQIDAFLAGQPHHHKSVDFEYSATYTLIKK